MRHYRRVFVAQGRIAIHQHGRHIVIDQPRGRAHHTFMKMRAGNFTFTVKSQFANHAQTIDLRIDGTQPVGENFRQHGNHAFRKINRGAAPARLGIERRARSDVIRNIGDRH